MNHRNLRDPHLFRILYPPISSINETPDVILSLMTYSLKQNILFVTNLHLKPRCDCCSITSGKTCTQTFNFIVEPSSDNRIIAMPARWISSPSPNTQHEVSMSTCITIKKKTAPNTLKRSKCVDPSHCLHDKGTHKQTAGSSFHLNAAVELS